MNVKKILRICLSSITALVLACSLFGLALYYIIKNRNTKEPPSYDMDDIRKLQKIAQREHI